MKTQLLLSSLAVLLASCTAVGPLTTVVGADGARIEGPEGVVLDIPAGALSDDTEIGIEVLLDLASDGWDAAPAFVDAEPAISVALTPHGLSFAQPVTLSLPFAGAPGDLVILRAASPDNPAWGAIGPITFDGQVASVAIDGFSAYTLVAAGNCPCFDGDDLRTYHARGATSVAAGSHRHWQDDVTIYPASDDGMYASPETTYEGPRSWYEVHNGGSTMYHAQATVTSITAGTGAPSRSCIVSTNGTPHPFADWFPEITITPPYFQAHHAVLDATQFQSCAALLRGGERGETGREVAVRVAGLPTGQTLELALDGVAFDVIANDTLVFAPQPVADGATYALVVLTQPTGATCSLGDGATGTMGAANVLIDVLCAPAESCNGVDDDGDGQVDEGFDGDGDGVTTCGPDGVPASADDDCDDTDDAIYPAASERCNGVDDDCDGSVAAGETADGDGDGVPDLCDGHPADACPVYDLADLDAVLAQPGAVCLVGATGAALPAPLAGEVQTFTGAFVDYGNNAWEAGGVAMDPAGDTFAPYGCVQPDATGYCTDNSRPLLPAGSEATADEYAFCGDLAAYACR